MKCLKKVYCKKPVDPSLLVGLKHIIKASISSIPNLEKPMVDKCHSIDGILNSPPDLDYSMHVRNHGQRSATCEDGQNMVSGVVASALWHNDATETSISVIEGLNYRMAGHLIPPNIWHAAMVVLPFLLRSSIFRLLLVSYCLYGLV